MKKTFVLCAGICGAMLLASCGSSKESAYRKAYEKAQAQEATAQAAEQEQTETPVVAPLTQQPVTETTVSNVDNAPVRSEDFTLVSGAGLQSYSVVVGSFSLKANAERTQAALKEGGYNAQIVKSSATNTYRVVATTFASKADAVRSRDAIRGTKFNPGSDAWLLYKK